jgi:hypothetical protein
MFLGIGTLVAGMALIAASKEIQFVGYVGVLLALIGAFLALSVFFLLIGQKRAAGLSRRNLQRCRELNRLISCHPDCNRNCRKVSLSILLAR